MSVCVCVFFSFAHARGQHNDTFRHPKIPFMRFECVISIFRRQHSENEASRLIRAAVGRGGRTSRREGTLFMNIDLQSLSGGVCRAQSI